MQKKDAEASFLNIGREMIFVLEESKSISGQGKQTKQLKTYDH